MHVCPVIVRIICWIILINLRCAFFQGYEVFPEVAKAAASFADQVSLIIQFND